MANEYGQPVAAPGEPRFVYVCKISDADEKKALAEAFAKAKAHATELSRAAGTARGTAQPEWQSVGQFPGRRISLQRQRYGSGDVVSVSDHAATREC